MIFIRYLLCLILGCAYSRGCACLWENVVYDKIVAWSACQFFGSISTSYITGKLCRTSLLRSSGSKKSMLWWPIFCPFGRYVIQRRKPVISEMELKFPKKPLFRCWPSDYKVYWHTLFQKRKTTWLRNPVQWFFCDIYANVLWVCKNREEFWNWAFGKFTDLHSSPKERCCKNCKRI